MATAGIAGRKGFSRPLAVVLLAAVVVIGTVVGILTMDRHAAPSPVSRPLGRFGLPLNLGHDPFAFGHQVTLAQAAAEAGYTIWRPNDPLASDASIQAVWTGPRSIDNQKLPPMVSVYYSSGIQENLETVLFPDPISYLQGMAKTMGPPKSFTRINGSLAVVIPPNSDAFGTNPTAIVLVKGGIYIELMAARVSLVDMERVAGTI